MSEISVWYKIISFVSGRTIPHPHKFHILRRQIRQKLLLCYVCTTYSRRLIGLITKVVVRSNALLLAHCVGSSFPANWIRKKLQLRHYAVGFCAVRLQRHKSTRCCYLSSDYCTFIVHLYSDRILWVVAESVDIWRSVGFPMYVYILLKMHCTVNRRLFPRDHDHLLHLHWEHFRLQFLSEVFG